jgi:hypothetical protein
MDRTIARVNPVRDRERTLSTVVMWNPPAPSSFTIVMPRPAST